MSYTHGIHDDAVDDFGIARAQALAQLRLEDRDVSTHLVNATADRQDAFVLLVCLARVVGLALRPDGYAGGPIGLERFARAPWIRADSRRDIRAAGRLVGAGARGDGDDVRALALAVFADPAGLAIARRVAGAMLEILAAEPVVRDPEGEPRE